MMSSLTQPSHTRIAILGSGFAGLCAAIRLRQEGYHDFVVLERADEVGGTWRDNSYPGCACDVESHLYSFSFAPNPAWSRRYAPQAEILAYLRRCAERFAVLPHVRFNHAVRAASWDEAQARWRIETSQGLLTADVLVSAAGPLSEPAMPAIPGLSSFTGKVFHSARWDHGHDLRGRRVAVIGTGASAIQFVPQIQPLCEKLHVFQRTPPWILPRQDRPVSPRLRWLLQRVPAAQQVLRTGIALQRELLGIPFRHPSALRLGQRLALRHLRHQVPDAALRDKLTPKYTLGCTRVLLSDDYLPALGRPNVEVVTDDIREITPGAILTADGEARQVDTILCATGFRVTDAPASRALRGRDGRSLAEVWRGSPQAHLGITVHGFPNLFMLLGPNTGLGHTSVMLMAESQVEHLLGALRFMDQRRAAVIEPTAEAQAAFIAQVDARMQGTVWLKGGCHSWYLDQTGRNSTLWPGSAIGYRRRSGRFDPTEYRIATD